MISSTSRFHYTRAKQLKRQRYLFHLFRKLTIGKWILLSSFDAMTIFDKKIEFKNILNGTATKIK